MIIRTVAAVLRPRCRARPVSAPTGGRRRRPGSAQGRRGRRRTPMRRPRAGRIAPGRRRGSSRAGSRWPWRTRSTVLDAFPGDGEGERVGTADGGSRVLAAVNGRPAEGGRDAADVLRVEHVHRAAEGTDRARQHEQVRLGAGGDDRSRVVQDNIGQECGLEGRPRGHHQDVLFQRDAQPVPVVGSAQEDRVLALVDQPVAQRERQADPARATQRR